MMTDYAAPVILATAGMICAADGSGDRKCAKDHNTSSQDSASALSGDFQASFEADIGGTSLCFSENARNVPTGILHAREDALRWKSPLTSPLASAQCYQQPDMTQESYQQREINSHQQSDTTSSAVQSYQPSSSSAQSCQQADKLPSSSSAQSSQQADKLPSSSSAQTYQQADKTRSHTFNDPAQKQSSKPLYEQANEWRSDATSLMSPQRPPAKLYNAVGASNQSACCNSPPAALSPQDEVKSWCSTAAQGSAYRLFDSPLHASPSFTDYVSNRSSWPPDGDPSFAGRDGDDARKRRSEPLRSPQSSVFSIFGRKGPQILATCMTPPPPPPPGLLRTAEVPPAQSSQSPSQSVGSQGTGQSTCCMSPPTVGVLARNADYSGAGQIYNWDRSGASSGGSRFVNSPAASSMQIPVKLQMNVEASEGERPGGRQPTGKRAGNVGEGRGRRDDDVWVQDRNDASAAEYSTCWPALDECGESDGKADVSTGSAAAAGVKLDDSLADDSLLAHCEQLGVQDLTAHTGGGHGVQYDAKARNIPLPVGLPGADRLTSTPVSGGHGLRLENAPSPLVLIVTPPPPPSPLSVAPPTGEDDEETGHTYRICQRRAVKGDAGARAPDGPANFPPPPVGRADGAPPATLHLGRGAPYRRHPRKLLDFSSRKETAAATAEKWRRSRQREEGEVDSEDEGDKGVAAAAAAKTPEVLSYAGAVVSGRSLLNRYRASYAGPGAQLPVPTAAETRPRASRALRRHSDGDRCLWRPSSSDRLTTYSDGASGWRNALQTMFATATHQFIDSHCHIDFLYDRIGFKGTFQKYMAVNSETFPKSFGGCVAVFCNPRSFSADGGESVITVGPDLVWSRTKILRVNFKVNFNNLT